MTELVDSKMQITTLTNLGTAFPSQWEGKFADGRDVYIRYRFGRLSVWCGPYLECRLDFGGQFDGDLSDDQLHLLLTSLGYSVLEWKQSE